jgi:hypothetical protein
MDFIIGLLLYKNPVGGPDFNIILIVINRYSKIVRYIIYYKIINFLELAKIIWEHVFLIFSFSNRIISN